MQLGTVVFLYTQPLDSRAYDTLHLLKAHALLVSFACQACNLRALSLRPNLPCSAGHCAFLTQKWMKGAWVIAQSVVTACCHVCVWTECHLLVMLDC